MFITAFYVGASNSLDNSLTPSITLREVGTSTTSTGTMTATVIDSEYEYEFTGYDETKDYTYFIDFGDVPNRYGYGMIAGSLSQSQDTSIAASLKISDILIDTDGAIIPIR